MVLDVVKQGYVLTCNKTVFASGSVESGDQNRAALI